MIRKYGLDCKGGDLQEIERIPSTFARESTRTENVIPSLSDFGLTRFVTFSGRKSVKLRKDIATLNLALA